MLADRLFADIIDRVIWLRAHFRKKHKLDEGVVGWAEEEIRDLGPGLRGHIRKRLAERMVAERRAAFMEAVFFELCRLGITDDEGQRVKHKSIPAEFEKLAEDP